MKPRPREQRDADDPVEALEEFMAEVRASAANNAARMKNIECIVAGLDDIEDFDRLEPKQLRALMNGTAGRRRRAGREAIDDAEPDDLAEERTTLGMVALGRANPSQIKATMHTGSNPDGGEFVLPVLSSEMTKRIRDISPMRRLARVVPMTSGDAFEEIQDLDDVGAEWAGELETRSDTSEGQLGKITSPLYELYASVPISTKLLETANAIDVGTWLEGKLADKFARTEGLSFVSGSGNGQPAGFLINGTDTTADGVRANDKLQHVISGAAAAVTPDALKNLFWTLRAAHRSSAAWLMSSATANAIDKLKDGQGEYLWRDGMTSGAAPSLLGRPVEFDENMPAIAGDAFPIAFGDWFRGYTINEMPGLKVLRNPYVTPGRVKFQAWRRVGGHVFNVDAIKLLKISA